MDGLSMPIPPSRRRWYALAMTTLVKTNLDIPIESMADLVGYFARGARAPEQWGIGVEVEKLIVDAETGEAAPYARIEELLQRLEAAGGWRGIREEGQLIALLGEDSSITLEPGGQIELSGRLCPHIHCCEGDFRRHIAQIVAAAEPLGLAFLGLGVQPFTPLAAISWVPKARYGIMGPYMLKTGDMGQRMMKQTAGLQVNIDYRDEADCLEKLRMAPAALAAAVCAFRQFAAAGRRAERISLHPRGDLVAHRYRPQRSAAALFQPEAGYATFVDYALDVPMYFILRDGRFLDLTRSVLLFAGFSPRAMPAIAPPWRTGICIFPPSFPRPAYGRRSKSAVPTACRRRCAWEWRP